MASFIIQCWGCDKMIQREYNCQSDHEAAINDIKSKGWRRKAFWSPNWDKGPWFCSDDCVNESHNAKEAQKYWEVEGQKEFEKYCRDPRINRGLLIFGAILFAIVSTLMLGEYISAKL